MEDYRSLTVDQILSGLEQKEFSAAELAQEALL